MLKKKKNRVSNAVETFRLSTFDSKDSKASTHNPNSKWLKAVIYIFAIAIHCSSVFYLLLFGLIPFLADWVTLSVLKVYEPKLFGACYLGCALLHLYGLVKVICRCFCCRKNGNNHGEISNNKQIESDNWFEEKLIIAECFEIPAASYQAWSLSNSVSSVQLALFLPFAICFNCYFTPLTLRSTNPMIRRYGTLFLDVFFDFVVGVFFQLLLLFAQLYEFYYIGNVHIANNPKWFTSAVLKGRFLLVTSSIDLATKIFPFILNFASVHTLITFVERSPSFNETKRKALNNDSKERGATITRSFLSYISFAWGTMIFILAVFGIMHPGNDCIPACVVQVYPWLGSSCNCVGVDFNCRKQNLTSKELHGQLDSVSRNLRSVRISQCELNDGVSLKSLSRFNQIFYLSVGYSHIKHWKSEGHKLPDTVVTLYVIETNLEEVPSFLTDSPPSQLVELIIQGSNIKHLPNHISKTWAGIGYLTIDYSKLAEFPKPLLGLRQLITLSLANNFIKEIPSNMPVQLNNLDIFSLSGNPITGLPFTFNNTLPLLSTFEITNTPLCRRVLKSKPSTLTATDAQIFDRRKELCKSQCSNTCFEYQVNNFICTKACNTEACKWDGGDCDYIES